MRGRSAALRITIAAMPLWFGLGFGDLGLLVEIAMQIKIDISVLRETKWSDYAIRFLFGGIVTAAAGLIAKKFGPGVGGCFCRQRGKTRRHASRTRSSPTGGSPSACFRAFAHRALSTTTCRALVSRRPPTRFRASSCWGRWNSGKQGTVRGSRRLRNGPESKHRQ